MPSARSRWVEVPASQYPWECEALAVLREGLPYHGPWRAWSNLQVIAQDGSVNEVDAWVRVGGARNGEPESTTERN